MLVGPPSSQGVMWWASVYWGGASQPGMEQPLSLAIIASRWVSEKMRLAAAEVE